MDIYMNVKIVCGYTVHVQMNAFVACIHMIEAARKIGLVVDAGKKSWDIGQ